MQNDVHVTQIVQRVEDHRELLKPLNAELALLDVALKRLNLGGRVEFVGGLFGNLYEIHE